MSLPDFFVSQGTIIKYLTCPRLYYWYSVRGLIRDVLNLNFFTGAMVHEGVQMLIRKKSRVLPIMAQRCKEEERKIRRKFPQISPDDEQKLEFQHTVVQGMLAAWKQKYAVFIRDSKPYPKPEIEIKQKLERNVIVVAHIDDVIENKRKDWVFELKTAGYINIKQIRNIAVNFQKSLYYYLLRMKLGKRKRKVGGLIFNVIQKPGIKLCKGESVSDYIKRLRTWYEDAGDDRKFFSERLKEPLLSEHETFNTIHRVVDIARAADKRKDYYMMNFESCVREWGRCEYWELCHEGGETKENMQLYKKKERGDPRKGQTHAAQHSRVGRTR